LQPVFCDAEEIDKADGFMSMIQNILSIGKSSEVETSEERRKNLVNDEELIE